MRLPLTAATTPFTSSWDSIRKGGCTQSAPQQVRVTQGEAVAGEAGLAAIGHWPETPGRQRDSCDSNGLKLPRGTFK
jgi:hypothetical protein